MKKMAFKKLNRFDLIIDGQIVEHYFKVVYKNEAVALCDNKFNIIKIYNFNGEEYEVINETNKR
tara:strand:+ start:176 stop:367 length:192 start_codon:yes stop_codon:yes gene_type:complete